MVVIFFLTIIVTICYIFIAKPYEKGLKDDIKFKNKASYPKYNNTASYPKSNNSELSKEKGNLFEEFIVKKFDSKYFKIIEWRSDKFIDGIYAESNKNPDFEIEFKLRTFSTRFSIECKFRSSLAANQIYAIEERKFNNYKRFEKEKKVPVYIVLGLGGQPDNPDELFLIPLYRMGGNSIAYRALKSHARPTDKSFYYNIESEVLK